jgi:hypothetical protein
MLQALIMAVLGRVPDAEVCIRRKGSEFEVHATLVRAGKAHTVSRTVSEPLPGRSLMTPEATGRDAGNGIADELEQTPS